MNKILCGDVLERLKTIPDESVQMCCTSPPYWGGLALNPNMAYIDLCKREEVAVDLLREYHTHLKRSSKKDSTGERRSRSGKETGYLRNILLRKNQHYKSQKSKNAQRTTFYSGYKNTVSKPERCLKLGLKNTGEQAVRIIRCTVRSASSILIGMADIARNVNQNMRLISGNSCLAQ